MQTEASRTWQCPRRDTVPCVSMLLVQVLELFLMRRRDFRTFSRSYRNHNVNKWNCGPDTDSPGSNFYLHITTSDYWLKFAFQFLLLRHETTITEKTVGLVDHLPTVKQDPTSSRRDRPQPDQHTFPTVSSSPGGETKYEPRMDRLFLEVWQETGIGATVMLTMQLSKDSL